MAAGGPVDSNAQLGVHTVLLMGKRRTYFVIDGEEENIPCR